MTIRVYELAKKFNLTSKELIGLLNDLGYDIKAHMSLVPEEAVQFLEEELSKKKKVKTIQKKSQKSTDDTSFQDNKKSTKEKIVKDLEGVVLKAMTPDDFSKKANKSVNDVIVSLLKQGIVATKNQILDESIVKKLAEIYNIQLIIPSDAEEVLLKQPSLKLKDSGNLIDRSPIVVVLGHVDHGKTTLLDYIRDSKVAIKEKGGITQHLGAYQVSVDQGNLVFLDTPGHEAFSTLRTRGIKAADIAILVVAADDGVMPQTIEAMKNAMSIDLPIIVAINKTDKADTNQIDSVKQQLSQHGLIPEEWGGQAIIVPISAKTGSGINDLLEVVVLQSQLLELKSDLEASATGYVLESNLEKGFGPVATVICQHGELKIGDYFFAGNVTGKVNSITDTFGNSLKKVGPSSPVKISGFSDLPNPGDIFEVVSLSKYRKGIKKTYEKPTPIRVVKDAVNLIIKTDNISSKEALLDSIAKLSKKVYIDFNVVYAGVGNIIEKDIIMASDTNSIIYGLHVKVQPNTREIIRRLDVKIKTFGIIYKLLEDLEEVAEASKPIEYITKKIGEAVVIKVFKIKKIGVVAGARVKSGVIKRGDKIIISRSDQKIGEGIIKDLQREKKSVKEVQSGFECAIFVLEFQDWNIDDKIECFSQIQKI